MIYLDTSALVKLNRREPESDALADWLDRRPRPRVGPGSRHVDSTSVAAFGRGVGAEPGDARCRAAVQAAGR
jgi:predicted nucleic acid-binding protein